MERGFRLFGQGQRAPREATRLKKKSVALVNILNAEVNYLTKHSDHTEAIEKCSLMVTDSLPSSAVKVPFGEAVTFTFQLVDNDGLPVPREGVRFVLEVQDSRASGTQLERTTLTKTTGPDGSARQTFLHVYS